jgi:hypothetical protein
VYLSADLKWTTHINHICSKASKRLFAIRILKRNGVKVWDLRNVYCSFIRPVLEYACPVWHFSLPVFLCDQIEQIQRRALKIIYPDLSYKDGLNELNLPTLVDRRVSLCKRFYENNFGTSSKTSDLMLLHMLLSICYILLHNFNKLLHVTAVFYKNRSIYFI